MVIPIFISSGGDDDMPCTPRGDRITTALGGAVAVSLSAFFIWLMLWLSLYTPSYTGVRTWQAEVLEILPIYVLLGLIAAVGATVLLIALSQSFRDTRSWGRRIVLVLLASIPAAAIVTLAGAIVNLLAFQPPS